MNYEWEDDFLIPVLEGENGEQINPFDLAEMIEEIGDDENEF